MMRHILYSEKGLVMPTVIALIAIITLLGVTAFYTVESQTLAGVRHSDREKALHYAEAGINEYLWHLNDDSQFYGHVFVSGGTSPGHPDYSLNDPTTEHAFQVQDKDGFYRLEITAPTTAKPMVTITSIGWPAADPSIRRTIEVKVPRPVVLEPPAAVYLGGGEVDIEFSGNAFKIDGNDSSTPAGPPVWGIAVEPGTILDVDINKNQEDNITGLSGTTPNIGVVPESEQLDLAALAEQYIKLADREILEDYELAGSTTWGTPCNPEVTYVAGDLEMKGNSSGAGVLIVKDGLEMGGNSGWNGIIIVLGEEMETGASDYGSLAGNPEIHGALLIKGGGDPESELDVRGNITIRYSSQAISMVSENIVPMTVSSWREIK